MPREKRNNHSRVARKQYDRETDCWNCGSSKHFRRECPHPGTLRCSHCRRQGVRTDECRCRREYERPQNQRFETAVLLNVEGKLVRAVVNTGVQETRIGSEVLEYLKSQRAVNGAKSVIKSVKGMETLFKTEVKIGDKRHLYDLECFVDKSIPKCEMIIGFRALIKLGYRVTVCGQEGLQRQQRVCEEPRKKISKEHRREREDDEISFLDEEEKSRLEEWMN